MLRPLSKPIAEKIKKEFDDHKSYLKFYFSNIKNIEFMMKVYDEKEKKLINKLISFSGDISPNMLVKLSELHDKQLEEQNLYLLLVDDITISKRSYRLYNQLILLILVIGSIVILLLKRFYNDTNHQELCSPYYPDKCSLLLRKSLPSW